MRFLLAGLLLAAATPSGAAMTDGVRWMRDAQAGLFDPATFDFAQAGFFEMNETQRHTWQWESLRGLEPPDQAPSLMPSVLDPMASCAPERRLGHAALAWSAAATKTDNAVEWRRVHAQLLQRRQKLDDEMDAAAATVIRTDGNEDLFRRFARDKVIHAALDDARWMEGMSNPARLAWYMVIRTRLLATVCDNTEWLKKRTTSQGWFGIRKFGVDADAAAWQLLQHSERDIPYQREMVRTLERMPKDDTSQQQLAYLSDEVAVWEGKQRFGTQRLCIHDGSSKMWPELEDPDHVNERRATMGLPPTDPAPKERDPGCQHGERHPPRL